MEGSLPVSILECAKLYERRGLAARNQRAAWFASVLNPAGLAFHLPGALLLQGTWSRIHLEQAVQQVLDRHPALRTALIQTGDQLEQWVLPPRPHFLAVNDCSGLDDAGFRRAHRRWVVQPFVLHAGTPIRFALFERRHERYLAWVVHHASFDGLSYAVLVHELRALYDHALRGTCPPDPPERDTIDFAIWQAAFLRSPRAARCRSWWRTYLDGLAPQCPGSAQMPPGMIAISATRLDGTAAAALRAQAKRARVSLYSLYLSAFLTVLRPFAQRDDLAVVSPFAGRPDPLFDHTIGMFVNMVVLRQRLAPETHLDELLAAVGRTALEVLDHADLPYDEILRTQPGLAVDDPFGPFGVCFVFQNWISPALSDHFSGANDMRLVDLAHERGGLPLTWEVYALADEVHLFLKYDTNRYSAERVAGLSAALERLLLSFEAALTRPLDELGRSLTASQFTPWLAFKAWARERPDHPALLAGEQRFGYREWLDRVRGLAEQLHDHGVTAETLVAIWATRSPATLAAMCAVVWAGAAYMPLDPALPLERHLHMLDQAGCRLVLAQPEHCEELTGLGRDLMSVALDRLSCFPAREVPPEAAAYVLTTSGSSGRPKGVVVSRQSLALFLEAAASAYGINGEDRILQLASLCFDTAVEELWTCLVRGATLVLEPAPLDGPPADLFQAISRQRITVLDLPTGLWHAWQEDPAFVALLASGTLRTLIIGGERALPSLMRAFLASPRRPLFWNSYGPTEATVVCSLWQAEPWFLDNALDQVPLGAALGRARLHVVDNHLGELGPDLEGELLIGGEILARGYLGEPAQTALHFVPDPFASLPGARLYRSGDRVRRDGPTAALVFLGRFDEQFKWRGFRVEPAEVERCLCTHPGIQRAHVRPWRLPGGQARLVAWYQTADAPEWRELRAWLLRELPIYMVPESFVAVTHWPLTERGKLDPSAFPPPREPHARQLFSLAGWEANLLQEIWREVLGLDWVGDHDHFFDLGGHSLAATRAAARIRQTLGRDMSLRAFHEHPVVVDPVRHLQQLAQQAIPEPPIRCQTASAPLAPAQERLFLLTERAAAARSYHIAGALRLCGPYSIDALEQALNLLVQRHGALRTAFEAGPRQRELPYMDGTLIVLDLTGLAESERMLARGRLAATWAKGAFRREHAPLWRVALLKLGGEEANLIWVIDHLICDAWSLDVLLQEWAQAYLAALQGRPLELSPLTWRYLDYATWRCSVSDPAERAQTLSFWRSQLADLPEVLPLPFDRPRTNQADPRGACVSFEMPADRLRDLQLLSQRLGVSLFSLLLTAWSLVLARTGGSDDVPVGCPVADRGHLAFEGVVGFFVDTVILRLRMPPGPGPRFADLVRHVHAQSLEAFARPQLPFEILVAELPGERTPAVHPLFQATYQHLHGAPGGYLGPCRCESLELDFGLAPFDLSLLTLLRGGHLVGRLTFRTALFNEATARRLADYWTTLLTSALEQPQSPAMSLDLIGAEQRLLLVESWSSNLQPIPGAGDLALAFEATAARFGALEALRKDQLRLSYEQLNRDSNRLAHHLRYLGVIKGSTVGLCLRPGPNLVRAMLAVIKAGGVYVPMDPEYPIDRIAFLSEDAALNLVVSDERAVFSFNREIAVVSPNDLPSDVPDHNPSQAWIGGRAYLCHTSGSTGRPKGVAVGHTGVLRLVHDTGYLRLGPGDCVAQAAHPAFDAITFEVWTTLLHGATLVHLEKHRLLQPRLLVAWLRQQGLTAMFLTTAVFNLCAREQPDIFRSLRYLLFGGEHVDPAMVARVLEQGPPEHLLHVYGPTESTTFSTWYEVTRVVDGEVPIGGPIANTSLLVFDRRLQPVPPGVVGELYLGGLGLAEGYLNCPRQTAESFIPHPFAQAPGQRLYRSGDAVRQGLRAGQLVFVNRVDHQAKIRGFRVEPAEVENLLRRAPGVVDCLVRAVAPPQTERYLAAWIVAPNQDPNDLRRFLEDQLPRFMVPAVLLPVDALPLTANGKIDWRALPDPERHRLTAQRECRAPRNELEHTIHQVWRDLLGGNEFGTADNFFSLGAHSLMMARACARLSEALGLSLPLEVLFDHPTVADLARYLELAQWSRAATRSPHVAEEEGLI